MRSGTSATEASRISKSLTPPILSRRDRLCVVVRGCGWFDVGWTDHEHALRRPPHPRFRARSGRVLRRVRAPGRTGRGGRRHRAGRPDVGRGRRARRCRDGAAGPRRPRPGRAARGAQPAAARGRRPRGHPAAHRRRRGVGQDPRADPPHRLAARRAGRAAGPDPRHHLHQQGGGRDARAGRGARRPARPDHVGHDLPLRVRAHPAARGGQGRHEVDLLDLRRRRQPAPHEPRPARPRPRPEALPAARLLARRSATSRTSSSTRRPTPRRSPRATTTSAPSPTAYTAVPAPPAPGQRARLRRHHHDDRQRPAGLPRRRRVLPPPLPARARRRVPGHQPGAVPAHQGARRRGQGTRGRLCRAAGRAVRRRRLRPVDLRLPRRDDPQHPRVRERLPRRPHHPARAELPLDAAHPARRQLRHRPQRGAPRQEPLDRLRRRAR